MTRLRPLAMPLLAAAIVAVAYGIWLRSFIATGGDVRSLVHVGQHFIDLQKGTPYAIHLPRGFPVYTDGQSDGYDGQWVYYIARDPLNAYHVLDSPSYRYGRILLPLVARLVAAGRESAIPGALLGINFFWIVFGTGALAFWLRRRGQPALLSLAYGLYPGLFVVLQFDLTEAMAYGLVAVGAVLLDVGGPRRRLWAGITFGLAALTRDLAVLFGAGFALATLLEGDWAAPWRPRLRANLAPALELGLPAVAPLAAWLLFVDRWLGGVGPAVAPLEKLPFLGLLHWAAAGLSPPQSMNVELVAVPAAICGAVCLWALYRRMLSPEWLVLALNVLIVIFMTRYQWVDFTAAGRAATGVTLAALLYTPAGVRSTGSRAWIWACAAIWLAGIAAPLVLPDLVYLLHKG